MAGQTQIEMHRVAVEMYKMEKDQYWVRCNVFLVINSALMVALTSDRATSEFRIIDCSVGMILCVAWLCISMHSEYYIKRWRDIIRDIEVKIDVQPFLSFPKDSAYFRIPRLHSISIFLTPFFWILQGGPSRVMNGVIVALMVLWTILGFLHPFDEKSKQKPASDWLFVQLDASEIDLAKGGHEDDKNRRPA